MNDLQAELALLGESVPQWDTKRAVRVMKPSETETGCIDFGPEGDRAPVFIKPGTAPELLPALEGEEPMDRLLRSYEMDPEFTVRNRGMVAAPTLEEK